MSRDRELLDEAIQYWRSFKEHKNKALEGLKTHSVYDVRGWIGDARGFADKAHEFLMKYKIRGNLVGFSNTHGEQTNSDASEADIDQWHQEGLDSLAQIEKANESR
jgi:hypothetical protein